MVEGLLIVNADDWGCDEAVTDAIAECFSAGRITSATGMVYMRDSDRAAAVAERLRLPVGLHINLTEPFSDPSTPPEVRSRQHRMTRFFSSRAARWTYDPRLTSAVALCISDQIGRFLELYGHDPTHFDGHHHVDVCPNVFVSRAIPSGSKVRNTLDCFPARKSPVAVARTIRQALASRRSVSTRYLFHIREMQPHDGPPDPKLCLADTNSVEVMAHPGYADEYSRLMSSAWGEGLRDRSLGSFADLQAAPGVRRSRAAA
jgi:chitin disaccharide deacetylase